MKIAEVADAGPVVSEGVRLLLNTQKQRAEVHTCLQATDLDKFALLLVVFGYRRRYAAASLLM